MNQPISRNNRALLLAAALLFHSGNMRSQEIPIGTWRTHISFQAVYDVAGSPTTIAAASLNGVLLYDLVLGGLTSLTKLNGLSGITITSLAFNQALNQLLIGYSDGSLDILRENSITQFTALKRSTTIEGSKRINNITIRQHIAYLFTDFGTVLFDLTKLEVKETWRDLGPGGALLKIYEGTFKGDSIFMATENGVLAGNLSDNLMDYNNWRRFNPGSFNNPVAAIASFNSRVYAALSGDGLYSYINGTWTKETFLQGEAFTSLSANTNLLITTQTKVWKLTSANSLTEIVSPLIQEPNAAIENGNGNFWIGDSRNGLIANTTGAFQSHIPNGPTFSGSFRLKHNAGKLYAVAGGFKTDLTPANKTESVNIFTAGMWKAEPAFLQHDVTDIDFSPSQVFTTSFTAGLQVVDNSTTTLYTSLNSPLVANRVSAIAYSGNGLWVANFNSPQPLHLLKPDNTWQSFSFPVTAAQFPVDLLVDHLGQVWMVLNPASGGGILVFNKSTHQHIYLTEAPGAGALPSRRIHSIASDLNGQVWVGSDAGVAYFPDPSRVFSGNVNAVKPIVNGRILLRDEKTTAIAVDGGNRKWFGTESGTWLFDSFGETQLLQFTAAESPLLSDVLHAIEINPVTGEVFFGTAAGIVSFRSDATTGTASFSQIKIFPNPVTSDFTGTVGISGLANDATVKITDASGRLVWQTMANGSTATWNVRDVSGKRATTGIYLVFAVSRDGSESVIGKIAVIN